MPKIEDKIKSPIKPECASPPLPFVEDNFTSIDGCSVFSCFDSPGHIDFQVAGYQQGFVQLSVVLPEELLKEFVSFFESAYHLFKASARKTKHLKIAEGVKNRAFNMSERERVDKFQSDLDNRICNIFDELIRQGISGREAIKRTNAALKDDNHSYASYDVVCSRLRACGRLKGLGLYKNNRNLNGGNHD